MASVDKIINKMKRQPNGIRLPKPEEVLLHYGYRLDRQKGSHCQYINSTGNVITIKNENSLKEVYVQRCVKPHKLMIRGCCMTVQDYMKMSYNYVIKPITDESGTYFYATVLELDGCQSTGSTFEEAYKELQEAMAGWIEAKLENGFDVPAPIDTEKYSGKFVVRLPKLLHSRLAMEAEREGVSLNQFALYKLTH